jgi:hypothetical protein
MIILGETKEYLWCLFAKIQKEMEDLHVELKQNY